MDQILNAVGSFIIHRPTASVAMLVFALYALWGIGVKVADAIQLAVWAHAGLKSLPGLIAASIKSPRRVSTPAVSARATDPGQIEQQVVAEVKLGDTTTAWHANWTTAQYTITFDNKI